MDEAERIPDLYERHALAFDRIRGKSLVEKSWLQRFMACLPPDGAVLDIGCGSGEPMAAALLSQGYAVTGIDSEVKNNDVVLFMKGTPQFPQCGFSGQSTSSKRMRPEAHAQPGAVLMFTSGPGEGTAIGTFEGEALHHASLSGAEYRDLLAANGFAVLDHMVEDAGCGGATVWLAQSF